MVKFEFYFAVIAFIAVIWISMYGSTNYGYVDTYGKSTLNMYAYEGFTQPSGVVPISDQIAADITPEVIHEQISSPDPTPNAFDNNKLKGADYSNLDPTDPMTKLNSSMSCAPSGLTKGSGNLCLTEDIKTQLGTRGLNNV